jgi:phage terminase Nu1 subunit (DNA packaging protein)
MDRRLSSEDLDWLCRIRIAKTANLTLDGIPANVARRLTMLHCADVNGKGEYSITLRGRDELIDRELSEKIRLSEKIC